MRKNLFSFNNKNSIRSSIATIKASIKNKALLYKYQNKFFKEAKQKGASSKIKAYVFGDPFDQNRNKAFLDVLLQHHIEVYPVTEKMTVKGSTFEEGNSYVVPTNQKQYYMVQSLFETYSSYRDSVFYDTSAWSMVNFYNMKYQSLAKVPTLGEQVTKQTNLVSVTGLDKSDYAYIIPYDDYYAPAVLYELEKNGLVVKVSTKPFTSKIGDKRVDFNRGALMIPVKDQYEMDAASIY